jgi:predicted small lipoprotein YifL
MRSLFMTLMLAGVLTALCACQHKKTLPVPAPQSNRHVDAGHPTSSASHAVLETIFSRAASDPPFTRRGCQRPRLLRF